jgi:hypothetical protein
MSERCWAFIYVPFTEENSGRVAVTTGQRTAPACAGFTVTQTCRTTSGYGFESGESPKNTARYSRR